MVRRSPKIVTGGDRRRHNLARHKESMRSQNLRSVETTVKPIRVHVDESYREANDFAAYGVFNTGDEWVLVAYSVEWKDEVATTDRRGGTRTKLRGRWLLTHDYTIENGLEIARADTKKALLNKLSATGSERVDTGAYLVRPKHSPRRQFEKVDRDDFTEFQRRARKIYE